MRQLALVIALGCVTGVSGASPAPAGADAPPSIPALLHKHYGTRTGYAKVTRDVLAWHGTRQNGCVAFASTALRHAGVEIPIDGKIDGHGVSRITRSFSRFLVEELGWVRIEALDELRAGDLVFSTDAPCCPGYPNHVMMFDGWSDARRAIAWVIDNQGFHVARPLIPAEGSEFDGFGYALRAPSSS
jgi:hypothetical protein